MKTYEAHVRRHTNLKIRSKFPVVHLPCIMRLGYNERTFHVFHCQN